MNLFAKMRIIAMPAPTIKDAQESIKKLKKLQKEFKDGGYEYETAFIIKQTYEKTMQMMKDIQDSTPLVKHGKPTNAAKFLEKNINTLNNTFEEFKQKNGLQNAENFLKPFYEANDAINDAINKELKNSRDSNKQNLVAQYKNMYKMFIIAKPLLDPATNTKMQQELLIAEEATKDALREAYQKENITRELFVKNIEEEVVREKQDAVKEKPRQAGQTIIQETEGLKEVLSQQVETPHPPKDMKTMTEEKLKAEATKLAKSDNLNMDEARSLIDSMKSSGLNKTPESKLLLHAIKTQKLKENIDSQAVGSKADALRNLYTALHQAKDSYKTRKIKSRTKADPKKLKAIEDIINKVEEVLSAVVKKTESESTKAEIDKLLQEKINATKTRKPPTFKKVHSGMSQDLEKALKAFDKHIEDIEYKASQTPGQGGGGPI